MRSRPVVLLFVQIPVMTIIAQDIKRKITSGAQCPGLVLLVWICFLVRGFFYSSTLPLWEGYDEWSHFAYIQHLNNYESLPLGDRSRVTREIQESLKLVPLPWMLREYAPPHITHDDYWKLSEAQRKRRQHLLASLPLEWRQERATEPVLLYEAQQPPLYYWLMSWPLSLASSATLPTRVFLIRYLSVTLASLVIPFGFLITRRLFGRKGLAVGLVALIAAPPEFLINVCRVSNESLAVSVYSILILLLIKCVEITESSRYPWLLGGTLGIGLLTKAYFLTALPAVILIFAWKCWSVPGRRKRVAGQAALALGLAFGISAWWYVRNKRHLGTWSGMQEASALSDTRLSEILQKVPQVDWLGSLDSAFFSHIWLGNWSFLQVRDWMYGLFGYIALLALIGVIILFARQWRQSATQNDLFLDPGQLLVLIVVYGFFILGVAYHVLLSFATKGLSSSTGWYIYCLVVSEAVLAVAGLRTLCPLRGRPWVIPAMTTCLVVLDLYATHFLLIPYYAGVIRHNSA